MNRPKPPIEWTDQRDLALRILHETGFTMSGIAQQLNCRRIEVINRSVALGLSISTTPNSKFASLVAQAQRALS